MSTRDRFLQFAHAAWQGGSSVYGEWSDGIARDDELLGIVDRAPEQKRQPVLVLGVCRLLGAPEGGFEGLRAWILRHSDELIDELGRRLTQTNDVRRVAPIAVALAAAHVDGPVALIEVGASAGLGLYPDRYAIDVVTETASRTLGDAASDVRVRVDITGDLSGPQDPALPRVTARLGLDLAPQPPTDADARRWLETLLWPGQDRRVTLLRNAFAVAAADPPTLIEGDAVDGLAALVRRAPSSATPVVITAGTLVYLPGPRRQAFVDLVRELGVRWISYEKTGSLAEVDAGAVDPGVSDSSSFATLALDGVALAVGDAHGTRLRTL